MYYCNHYFFSSVWSVCDILSVGFFRSAWSVCGRAEPGWTAVIGHGTVQFVQHHALQHTPIRPDIHTKRYRSVGGRSCSNLLGIVPGAHRRRKSYNFARCMGPFVKAPLFDAVPMVDHFMRRNFWKKFFILAKPKTFR